jgi:hypothetical protein
MVPKAASVNYYGGTEMRRLGGLCNIRPGIGTVTLLFATLLTSAAACAAPAITEIARYQSGNTATGVVNSIHIEDQYLYLSLDAGGLAIFRKCSPYTQIAALPKDVPGSYAIGMLKENNLIYLADWHAGLRTVDVSDVQYPTRVATWNDMDLPGQAKIIAKRGDVGFLTVTNDGLYSLDMSDPHNIQTLGCYPELSEPLQRYLFGAVYPADGNALIVTSYRRLLIFNASNPEALTLNTYKSIYPAKASHYHDDLLYVSRLSAEGYLRIYDMQNPYAPVLLTEFDDPRGTQRTITAIQREGRFLFLLDERREIMVFEISDLYNPHKIASWAPPGEIGRFFAHDIDIEDGLAYVGTRNNGVILLDVSEVLAVSEPASAGLLLLGASMTLLQRLRRRRP